MVVRPTSSPEAESRGVPAEAALVCGVIGLAPLMPPELRDRKVSASRARNESSARDSDRSASEPPPVFATCAP